MSASLKRQGVSGLQESPRTSPINMTGLVAAVAVFGKRWSLLIVGYLLANGPSRYTDICDGLQPIATNLLASRLRELETQGVLRRVELDRPIGRTVFCLTTRGEQLRAAIGSLAHWGGRSRHGSDPSN